MNLTIDDIQSECDAMRGYDPIWYDKMMHRIPKARVVDRVQYIMRHCKNKRILHLGCGWPPGYLHQAIKTVSNNLVGIDISIPESEVNDYFCSIDLDSHFSLPDTEFDLILVAEILEHLSNPGSFLHNLKNIDIPILITVPNAFSRVAAYHISGGIESVNKEHVAWYSWHTLKVLVERYSYSIEDFCWYNGLPGISEGLIMLVR